MIKWCSYCQHYMGEVEPLDDYRMTHGICPVCKQRLKARAADEQLGARIQALGERMMANAFERRPENIDDLLREGRELGLRPIDLALGVLQPSLYRVGELWVAGVVTVEDEHRFTAFAKELLDKVSAQVPDRLLRAPQPRVLLARPEGNEHDLGVRVLGLHLASEGIASRTLPEPCKAEQVLSAVHAWQPRIIALSVSMLQQIHSVEAIAAAVRAASAPGQAPEIVVGGLPFRNGRDLPMKQPVRTFRGVLEFLEHCREPASGGALNP
ncbi:cobalamin B12-binding domain-containing protein [Thiococcus pfennigii]|uniref:cobalamin B12-binding domain-containing protein n=1 Tax=Thiococcus pfennigii TaxID=1057 RepID=UPI001903F6C9|nr:cobalamin-dependent protein [Thiococcus pfennigii]